MELAKKLNPSVHPFAKIISSEEYAFMKFFNLFLTSSYLAVVSEDNTYVPLWTFAFMFV